VGMCLIAATTFDVAALTQWVLVILSVAAGLGAVIFVHELGHFLVAKACGVKCEKFMIGFDIGGYKLSRRWGETEYGIGILPLGGYVKMLGQDDNPANIAEQVRESQVAGNSVEAKEILGPDGKTYLVDKRSYLAKSVPQRMAIISAGVVMNIIFAFIFATIAYKLGVPYNPSIVSQTAPGTPAWQADIRPGDEVVEIADVKDPSFTDLKGSVMLGDVAGGIPVVIRRNGELLPPKKLFPNSDGGVPRVGIAPPNSLRLLDKLAAFKGTPAAAATPAFEPGDEIVEVNGQPVDDYADYTSILIQHPEEPLKVKVRRGGKAGAEGEPATDGELVEITVAPRPVKGLGLVMEMGRVAAVQDNSPAAGKIHAGDFIDRVDVIPSDAGEGDDEVADAQFDPMTLPEELRRLAETGGEVNLQVRSSMGGDGRQAPETIVLPLRRVTWMEGALGPIENEPVVATALGVAYRVLSVVDRVEPGSPAAEAGLAEGDVIEQAEFVFPDDMKEKPEVSPTKFSRAEDEEKANWPAFLAALQDMPTGTKVKLAYKRGDKAQEVTLAPTESKEYFVPERGLVFDWIERTRVAGTWGEAVTRGYDETVSSLGMVYRFLGKLGHQVSFTSLGGPITIAQAAGFSAFEGPGKLLVFLTMLSANLAVINFLPIPLLDGGHMVFLLWEGIRGKPAGEKFVVAMHTAGFVFIITLMAFVISLDLGLIERNL
jgi:regulator of sigma E protease